MRIPFPVYWACTDFELAAIIAHQIIKLAPACFRKSVKIQMLKFLLNIQLHHGLYFLTWCLATELAFILVSWTAILAYQVSVQILDDFWNTDTNDITRFVRWYILYLPVSLFFYFRNQMCVFLEVVVLFGEIEVASIIVAKNISIFILKYFWNPDSAYTRIIRLRLWRLCLSFDFFNHH